LVVAVDIGADGVFEFGDVGEGALKTALAQPNFGTSDPAEAGSIADAVRAARAAEAVVLDLMAGLDDAERGKAIRLLAELRDLVPDA
jgi:hypothetical protein